MTIYLLVLIFFIIAAVYASVGLGGGSSYVAILLVAGLAVQDVRLMALLCNIIVVGGASYRYVIAGAVPWRKILPIVLLSVPLAYIGGTISLSSSTYTGLAGVALLIAAALLVSERHLSVAYDRKPTAVLSAVGGGIGFLSGLIGIGGGIFLAPLLHLTRWEEAKTICVTASIFILVNSLSGMAGQLQQQPSIDVQQLILLGMAVLIGGQIGTRYSIKVLSPHHIRRITGILVGIVAIRLLYTTFVS